MILRFRCHSKLPGRLRLVNARRAICGDRPTAAFVVLVFIIIVVRVVGGLLSNGGEKFIDENRKLLVRFKLRPKLRIQLCEHYQFFLADLVPHSGIEVAALAVQEPIPERKSSQIVFVMIQQKRETFLNQLTVLLEKRVKLLLLLICHSRLYWWLCAVLERGMCGG